VFFRIISIQEILKAQLVSCGTRSLRWEVERLRQGLKEIGLGDYADPEWKARELIGMND
jgi:hypothetical protein